MNKKQRSRSAMIIIVISFLSKIFGFVREILIGAKFGTSMEIDTYFLASAAITIFSILLTRSFNTILIPILTEIEVKEGIKRKYEYINNLLNISLVFSVALITIAFISAPLILKLMAPGFKDEEQFKLGVLLIRIGLPSIFFYSTNGILIGYLHTANKFAEGSALTIPLNVSYIIFLLSFSDRFGVVGLMAVSTLGALLQVIMIVIGVRKTSFKYRFVFNVRDEYFIKFLKILPPILISIGIINLNSIVDKSMGSGLKEGSIAALNYSEKLGMLIDGIFITAITTVMYPYFAKTFSEGNLSDFKAKTKNSINLILFITIPASFAMMYLSIPIVRVAFERNNFDSVATIMTSSALVFVSLRVPTMSIMTILNNIFYSLHDTKTPLFLGIFSLLCNIIFNIILINSMQHNGLALATTISSYITVYFSIILLRKRIGPFGFYYTIVAGAKIIFASFIMAFSCSRIFCYLSSITGDTSIIELSNLLFTSFIGVIIYLIIVYLLKVKELNYFISAIKERYI